MLTKISLSLVYHKFLTKINKMYLNYVRMFIFGSVHFNRSAWHWLNVLNVRILIEWIHPAVLQACTKNCTEIITGVWRILEGTKIGPCIHRRRGYKILPIFQGVGGLPDFAIQSLQGGPRFYQRKSKSHYFASNDFCTFLKNADVGNLYNRKLIKCIWV